MNTLDRRIESICDTLGATYLHTTQAEANVTFAQLDNMPVVVRAFPPTSTIMGKFMGEYSVRGAFYFCTSKGDASTRTQTEIVPLLPEAVEVAEEWRRGMQGTPEVMSVTFGNITPFSGLLSSNLVGVMVDVTILHRCEC